MLPTNNIPARYVMVQTRDGMYAKAMLMGGGKEWIVNEDGFVWKIPHSDVTDWFYVEWP